MKAWFGSDNRQPVVDRGGSRAYLSVRQRNGKAFKTETWLAERLKNEALAKLDISTTKRGPAGNGTVAWNF